MSSRPGHVAWTPPKCRVLNPITIKSGFGSTATFKTTAAPFVAWKLSPEKCIPTMAGAKDIHSR